MKSPAVLANGGAYEAGAGKESRTLDLNLGKVALYQLSYSREKKAPDLATKGFP